MLNPRLWETRKTAQQHKCHKKTAFRKGNVIFDYFVTYKIIFFCQLKKKYYNSDKTRRKKILMEIFFIYLRG